MKRLLPAVCLLTATLVLAGCGPNLFERMDNWYTYGCCGIVVLILDVIAIIELLGSNRSFGDKVLWILVVIFMPVLGCVLYYLFGRK